MKMKKLSALLMSGVLAASALVGCGSDAQSGAQAQTDNTTATQTAQADSNSVGEGTKTASEAEMPAQAAVSDSGIKNIRPGYGTAVITVSFEE
jgi:uncharacterized lipoprotein YbaY